MKVFPQKEHYILVGVPPYNKKIKIHTLQIHFGKRIIGSQVELPIHKKVFIIT